MTLDRESVFATIGDMSNDYQKQIERLFSLGNLYQPTNTRNTDVLEHRLQNIRAFLAFLGNPQKNFKIVQIAGTSGKGSVAMLLHHILRAEGKNVATTISPFTTTFLERFQYNEGLLPVKKLIAALEILEEKYAEFLEDHPPLSNQDLYFATAMIAFSQVKPDWVILEAFVGGRYDSTNALEENAASIITFVDKDHQETLGETLEEIAQAKAGIIKNHGLAIVGETRPRLRSIFTDEAIAKEAALFFAQRAKPEFEALFPVEYEQLNARLAVMAAEELDIADEVILKGLKNYRRLPCRFETISKKPLVILDGAHNPAKMEATANHLKKLGLKPVVIFGTVAGKEVMNILKKLLPQAEIIHTTRATIPMRKVSNPHTLMKMIPKAKRGKAFIDPQAALEYALENLGPKDCLLVTGSLFLAGELRAHWVPEELILKKQSSYPV